MPKDSQRKLTLTELLLHYQLLETRRNSQVNARPARTKGSVSQKQKKKKKSIFNIFWLSLAQKRTRTIRSRTIRDSTVYTCIYIYIYIYIYISSLL